MSFVGGQRARLIHDSLYHMVKNSLTQLGWFDSGRQHKPFTFSPVEIDDLETIQPNTIVLVDGGTTSVEGELGSQLADMRRQFYVDMYMENRVLGIEVSNDVKDILEGRYPSIGRSGPVFAVYDYSQATPPILFFSEIAQVIVDRAHNSTRPWEKHYYSVALVAIDAYADDDDLDGMFPAGTGTGDVDGGSP